MADGDKKAIKLAAKEAKKDAMEKVRELNKIAKLHPAVDPRILLFARPLLGGGVGRALGMLDGRLGTAQNKHYPTMVVTAVAAVGFLAAGFGGAPTLAEGLSVTAAVGIGVLQYTSGTEQGEQMKAQSGAAG